MARALPHDLSAPGLLRSCRPGSPGAPPPLVGTRNGTEAPWQVPLPRRRAESVPSFSHLPTPKFEAAGPGAPVRCPHRGSPPGQGAKEGFCGRVPWRAAPRGPFQGLHKVAAVSALHCLRSVRLSHHFLAPQFLCIPDSLTSGRPYTAQSCQGKERNRTGARAWWPGPIRLTSSPLPASPLQLLWQPPLSKKAAPPCVSSSSSHLLLVQGPQPPLSAPLFLRLGESRLVVPAHPRPPPGQQAELLGSWAERPPL